MSKIEWTDATWNPVRGCSRVSAGCQRCYAERMAARFSGCSTRKAQATAGVPFSGFAFMGPDGPRWTGRVELIPEKLDEPLRWKKPRRVFVNSMSDLFHEELSIPKEIYRVLDVCREADRHTFQILTKRPKRMDTVVREWLQDRDIVTPPPNVWLGVSCENQATADERIPLLLQTPAAKRFVSLEPLLGPIDASRWLGRSMSCDKHGRVPFTKWMTTKQCGYCMDEGRFPPLSLNRDVQDGLDWVIVGGESGPGARDCYLGWIRYIVLKCRKAGVPCFVKQLGAWWARCGADHRQIGSHRPKRVNAKGGDPSEWPEDLRVRETP